MSNQPPRSTDKLDSASIARIQHYNQTMSARVLYRQANPWPVEGVAVHPKVIAAAASVAPTMTPLVWPHGVRYEHWSSDQYPIPGEDALKKLRYMKSCGVVGYLLLTDGNAGQGPSDGDSGIGFLRWVKQYDDLKDIDWVIRFYRPVRHGWTDAMTKAVEMYLRLGVNKFQTTNEPDLSVEWNETPDWTRWLEIAFGVWFNDAHMLNSLGAWAVTPPMASGVFRNRGSGVGYWGPDLNPFTWCMERQLKIIIGCHAYLLNHPWDYPYDEVNQTGKPLTREEYLWASENGRWSQAWGNDSLEQVNAWRMSDKNPGATLVGPKGDDACGMVFDAYKLKGDEAGYTDVDYFSGEGWAVNMNRQDRRYSGNTPPVMAENNLKHFGWLGQHPQYRGNAGWILASHGWASDQHCHPGVPEANSDGYLFAVAKMKEYPAEDDFENAPVVYQQPIRVKRYGTPTIETMELEEYLRGVTPAEMPALWDMEALKAQSVAARSFALCCIERRKDLAWDVDDTTNFQVYNPSMIHPRSDQAVKDTAGVHIIVPDPANPPEYISKCGRLECPYCKGENGYNDQTWYDRMCQYGAQTMATQGSTYQEILRLYYGDIELSNEPVPEPPEGDVMDSVIICDLTDAKKYNVTIKPAQVTAGQGYWQVKSFQNLTANDGRHNFYCDVLKDGLRQYGTVIQASWPPGGPAPVTFKIEKPLTEPGGNMAINKHDFLTFVILGSDPCEQICNVNTQFPGDPSAGSSLYHWSFEGIWQWAIAGGSPEPEPDIDPFTAEDRAQLVTIQQSLAVAQQNVTAILTRHKG